MKNDTIKHTKLCCTLIKRLSNFHIYCYDVVNIKQIVYNLFLIGSKLNKSCFNNALIFSEYKQNLKALIRYVNLSNFNTDDYFLIYDFILTFTANYDCKDFIDIL